jgi:chromosome partition protein MukB
VNRTRATSLVLVNWRGVFYERYQLDRHVTALEGANGSGKTTVMIAAYLCLLPDMSRVRFTNLGETGATGGDKGVWGRLGEPGRPSYTALDFQLPDGTRLIAGVHLERKGEPSVEPTPFVVTGLGADIRLQELLLVAHGDIESVPELSELRENAARLGGRLIHFSSARDYFTTLFEHGVTPLRLSTDEERNKLNEMLRTSMTGGISRALTSELRSFLLRQQPGLADTLQRMRSNLDACRRTRTEVQDAQRLHREINDVFEAGQQMFAAAVLATRERAEEYRRRVEDAAQAQLATSERLGEAERALTLLLEDLQATEHDHAGRVTQLDEQRVAVARIGQALRAADELRQRRVDLEAAEERGRTAAADRDRDHEARKQRRLELRRAEDTYLRAAEGLANVQSGLEELHRRAAEHAQVMRRRSEAQRRLGDPAASVERLDATLTQCRLELSEVDRERRGTDERLCDAGAHRDAHREVRAALGVVLGHEVAIETAYAVACEQLDRLRDLESSAARVTRLARELTEARHRAAQQQDTWRRAEAVGVTRTGELPATQLERLHDEAESERARLEAAGHAARAALEALERDREALAIERRELLDRQPRWQGLNDRAIRIADALQSPLTDRVELDAVRSRLAQELSGLRQDEEAQALRREQLHAEARELLTTGGAIDPNLLRLKDDLGSSLLAANFEEATVGEAALFEARLGPLTQAVVVDDPQSAAKTLTDRPSDLSSLWLVSPAEGAALIAAVESTPPPRSADVLVREGPAWRLTRIPSHPRLGRKARERRAAELLEDASFLDQQLVELRAHRRTRERLASDADTLLAEHATWLAGDPGPALIDAERRAAEAERQADRLRQRITQRANEASALAPRLPTLRTLLRDARLLDPPDASERAAELAREHDEALAAQSELARCASARRVLSERLEVLRRPPLSDEDVARLRDDLERLRQRRGHLFDAIDALQYVADHRDALQWTDAATELEHQQALMPALQNQELKAREARELTRATVETSEARYQESLSKWQEADARCRVAEQERSAADERLRETGIVDPSPVLLAEAQQAADRLALEVSALDRRLAELRTQQGVRSEQRDQAARRQREADEKLAGERREAEPALQRWERLQVMAAEHRLLGSGFDAAAEKLAGVRGQVNLVQTANRHAGILSVLLKSAHGGDPLLPTVRSLADETDRGDLPFGERYLQAWITIRSWLTRRLPAQVAEVDDPLEALVRLRDQLEALELRLKRQENDLRGASEDIARGIDVQVRKARGQVNRLNKNLDSVSFGSIRAIRVRMEPDDGMERVLRALRDGAAQELLFQDNLPIEQALEEVFRRHADAGGRMGGHRLLDYREYLHLKVEVRRQVAPDWEVANPTKLSTGEAIGVGAALMMVVLGEWERDANLLRATRSTGSLRLLFLDEANRLSQDNLAVLFDLCQTLDLQLLIAAPEVALAEGNTTYRLVRLTTADGREEVRVTGRRPRAEA